MQKREKLGLSVGGTDPYLDEIDDEDWQIQADPPELLEARKKLNQYLAAYCDGVHIPETWRLQATCPMEVLILMHVKCNWGRCA
jgi:hypothetical protein